MKSVGILLAKWTKKLLFTQSDVMGISEVPSEARNLDGAIAKSDMHLLGDPVRGEPQ